MPKGVEAITFVASVNYRKTSTCSIRTTLGLELVCFDTGRDLFLVLKTHCGILFAAEAIYSKILAYGIAKDCVTGF